ncbi:MAG: CHAD domain-containing protein [Pseudomonadota bacterium]
MHEMELKFLLDEPATRRVMAGLRRLRPPDQRLRWRKITSTYYDTPDFSLRAAGIALRLRRADRRWVQTIKISSGLHAGLSEADEFETPAAGGVPSLQSLAEPVREEVARLVSDAPLLAVCESIIRRNASRVDAGRGTQVEIALDVGEIRAGGRQMPLQELELELCEGEAGALYDLAATLVPEPALRFSSLSKGARGFLLAQDKATERAPEPRTARPVRVQHNFTTEQAAREIFRECFDQVVANVQTVLASDHPEGPHQLRVGLRRLRSGLAIFNDAFGTPKLAEIHTGARDMGRLVGTLRDLDVAHGEMVLPLAEEHRDEPGFALLAEALSHRAAAQRAHLRKTLAADEIQSFLMSLARFVETRGWLVNHDRDQTRRLAEPFKNAAIRVLDRHERRAKKLTKRLSRLSIEERHELRKRLKTLRYVIEFCGPVFREKRVKAYVKRLRRLQNVLGSLSDMDVIRGLLSAPDSPGAENLAIQRASGWLLGATSAKADLEWTRAQTLLRDLEAEGPFWR